MMAESKSHNIFSTWLFHFFEKTCYSYNRPKTHTGRYISKIQFQAQSVLQCYSIFQAQLGPIQIKKKVSARL